MNLLSLATKGLYTEMMVQDASGTGTLVFDSTQQVTIENLGKKESAKTKT